ncbi:MAG: T9SS type A sorting domain-containing protein [Ignavibacteriales bacterium]|nr:MAG: T9SS type A sorting domain-containing protein [Ignavibacteriales bacterium]
MSGDDDANDPDSENWNELENGCCIKFFNIKGQSFCQTSSFPYFWENSLALIPSQTGNHPQIVWGPYPNEAIDSYKIYRKVAVGNYTHIASTANNVFEYVDDEYNISPTGASLNYYVTAVLISESETSSTNVVTTQGTGLEEEFIESQNVNDLALQQNYPNPFNPTTNIQYSIPTDGLVSLIVFDLLGREVVTLVNESKTAGNYTVNFDASTLASGTYIYQLRTGEFLSTKKMLMIK